MLALCFYTTALSTWVIFLYWLPRFSNPSYLMVSISYEKQYMEDVKLKSTEQVKEDNEKEIPKVGTTVKAEAKETKKQSKTSTSSPSEQDLDVFLLGDLGDSDEGPGILLSPLDL